MSLFGTARAKKCVKAMTDKNANWDKHANGWDYPADTANYCPPTNDSMPGGFAGFNHWIEPGSYHCTMVAGQNHTWQNPSPGYNSNYNSQAWCTQPSCYVDPCTCNKMDIQSSSWFKKANNGKIYYSGQVCGQDFTFKAALCAGQTTQSTCEADVGCKWTPMAATTAAATTAGSTTGNKSSTSSATMHTAGMFLSLAAATWM
jgi:hypothetical protein